MSNESDATHDDALKAIENVAESPTTNAASAGVLKKALAVLRRASEETAPVGTAKSRAKR